MKVVYDLIKYPLIYCFLGCLVLELISFIIFFFTFNDVLVKNETKIKETLSTQTDEFFNSINFLLLTRLNSVSNELLLFNQHMSIKYQYELNTTKTNYDTCEITNSFYANGFIENIIKEIVNTDMDKSTKLKTLFNAPILNQISYYSVQNYLFRLNENLKIKIKSNICYALSFFKSAFIKNLINNEYKEKLNYTLYTDDVIFFYPPQRFSESILKTIPFYNPSMLCRDEKYTFRCSSILLYPPTEENFTFLNSIIFMKLKLSNKNLYINSCLSINDRENEKYNMDDYFLYSNDSYPFDPPNNYLCIISNLSNILENISQDSNYFIFNIIQYDSINDNIQVFYSSNENLYKDISLNKNPKRNLFSSEDYGKYRIEDNSIENVADLFHSLYYEIEKYDHPNKNIEELINEYENNIKEIKKLISTKSNKAINGYKLEVNQSHINCIYDNKGEKKYNESAIVKNEFIYYLRPIVTDKAKISNNSNTFEKNKKIIFYTITIMKVTKPKNTSFIYAIYLFICGRIFFYCVSLEFFICIFIYIFIFFLMRCILNPVRIFKLNLENLLDNINKKKKDEDEDDSIKKNDVEKERNNSMRLNTSDDFGKQRNYKEKKFKNTNKSHNKNEKKKDIAKNEYMKNFIKVSSEIERIYTNFEMKEIENIICFLQKILLLRDENAPYQAKAEFYQSISSEISKKYQLDLFKCQILIGKYYIRDKQYLKAKNELENLQIRIEQSKNELINKDKFNERKNGLLSSYYGTYINDYTTNSNIKEDKFIKLEMISESNHYLIGIANYFLFLELKHGKKKFLNEIKRQKTLNPNKSSYKKEFKINNNQNLNNAFDINSSTNNIISQMDYYLEKAIKHFKESYKINNSLQINQIKNIIILVYLSKCYIEFSNKSVEDSNKVLKKSFLALTNFNELIVELTENDYSIKRKKVNTNFDYLFYKNYGSSYISQNVKECYVDSRVMLIVNGTLIQFILYQIGKMSLKLHKYKVAYYCFVKLIQISFYKNENLHFRAIKWLRFLINNNIDKKKYNISTLKSLTSRLKFNKNNNNEDEDYINKSSIDYMKKFLVKLVEQFEKNKYKRREKKTIIEFLSTLDKKLVYRHRAINDDALKKKQNFKMFSKNYFSRLNQTESSLTSSIRDLNISISGYDTLKNQENEESPSSQRYLNIGNHSQSPNMGKREKNKKKNFEKIIYRSEYESIIKSFISRDLLIAQIINFPLKIKEEEKNMKCIDKQYFRLNPKGTNSKCLIIILSESFLQNFSSLKSFNLFIQDCIVKFLEDTDKIGYILYSFSTGYLDKTYELEYKSKALKVLDELFSVASNLYKNKKSHNNKSKYLTDSFDMAMEMFNNEQLNSNADINSKTDKYIFCFGTLTNLRYRNYEASFAQKNRLNYMEISLYYFVFDSIDYYQEKIQHYRKYFKKFIEGFLIFVENFKLIKLCFANICIRGKQKNLFSNKLECIQNII